MKSPIFGELSLMDKKRRTQICLRIGSIAAERLRQIAEMFDMKPGQYVKALLYKDLDIFKEPLDRRKRRHRRKLDMEDWELQQSFEE